MTETDFQSDPVPERRAATPLDWVRLAVPVVALVGLILWARQRGFFEIDRPEEVAAIARGIRHTPELAASFVGVYAGLSALGLPVAPLGYGAGALYGFRRGVALVWVASMIGAAAGYFLARGILHGPAMRLLGRFGPFLHSLRNRHGFLTVLRIQLLPVIAFGPFNYAAGIARIPFWPFMAATGLGIIPGTLAIVYVGDRVMAGFRGEEGHPFLVAAAVAVSLVVLSFVPTMVTRQRRRARRRRAGSP